jgi:hypothetical protein
VVVGDGTGVDAVGHRATRPVLRDHPAMNTVLIVLGTLAGLKLAKYLFEIWWENYA